MTEDKSPQTLTDLLQTLERSQELRSLARKCGLTVRELRKRLAAWRRELKAGRPESADGADPRGQDAAAASATAAPTAAVTRGAVTRGAVTRGAGARGAGARGAGATGQGAAGRDAMSSRQSGQERFPVLPAAADFQESPLPQIGSPVLEIYTDGASRGNPGPAAVGIVFRQQDGPFLCGHAEAIGRATNNQAEYRALLIALEYCDRWGVPRVHMMVDSELVARQMMGIYRVKSPDLMPLFQQALHLARRRREFRIRHIPRAQNAHADHLANSALVP